MATIKEIVLDVISDLHLSKQERKGSDEIQALLRKKQYDFPKDQSAYSLVAKFFDIFYRAYPNAWQRTPNSTITEQGLVRILQTVEEEKFKYKNK